MPGTLLPLSIPCQNTHSKTAQLAQAKGQALEAPYYDARAIQRTQGFMSQIAMAFSEAYKISELVNAKFMEFISSQAQEAQTFVGINKNASQQTMVNVQVNLKASHTSATSKTEKGLQEANKSENSQEVEMTCKREASHSNEGRVQGQVTHQETSTTSSLGSEDSALPASTSGNGGQDSANHDRRSQTYMTEQEIEERLENQQGLVPQNRASNTSQLFMATADKKDSGFVSAYANFAQPSNSTNPYANNSFGFKSANSFGLMSSRTLDMFSSMFSPENILAQVMLVLSDMRSSALELLRLLGGSAKRSTDIAHKIAELNNVTKELLRKIESGADEPNEHVRTNKLWVWADEHGEPLPEYKDLFRMLDERGITIEGKRVQEWLKTQSTVDEVSDDRRPRAKYSIASSSTLLTISNTLDHAGVVAQDANSELQSNITYQMEFFQSMQQAVVNSGYVINSSSKSAADRIPL